MKNIWLWNHYASDMYKNQGGRHFGFAENLIKQGYKATIFCANTYHNSTDFIDTGNSKYATDTVKGIPFVFIKTAPAIGNGVARIKNMWFFYKHLFPVVKDIVKENGKPDVIIASSVHPLTMVAGIKIAKNLNIPCICEVRDLWPETIFMSGKLKSNSIIGRLLTSGERWIYKNADAMIFTKEGDTDYLKEMGWDIDQGGNIDLLKYHYINNGIDLEKFINSTAKYSIDDPDLLDSKFNVIYAGALRPINNVGNILDCATLLKNESDIQFLIYGDGNEKDLLQRRIVAEKLTNVKIKGYIHKKFIPYILSKSSVNILNYSHLKYNWSRGNSSNKLFEYMASGKPIISTVKMGYCILEKYRCGFSLQESTPEELARTITKVRDMPKDQYNEIGRNARNGAKDFDFSVLTKKLIGVIDNVCNQSGR